MMDYSNYRQSAKDTQLWSEKKIFQNQLYYEGEDVFITNSDTSTKVSTKAIIRNHSNPLNEEKEDRKIIMSNKHDVKLGYYIETTKDDNAFMVITKARKESVHQIAKIMECNNVLTIQDDKTLKIHKLPCLLQDKTSVYADGILDGKIISLPDDQIMMTVPNNEITREITSGKKIIFNHNKHSIYKTKRIDSLTKNGLIFIRAVRDVYDPNVDNLELNISTYVEPEETPTEPPTPVDPTLPDKFTIEIQGAKSVTSGTSETYMAVVKNNGVVVDEPVTWKFDNKEISALTMTSFDTKSCTISCSSFSFGMGYLDVFLDKDISITTYKSITATR